ncbi:MAG: hypothetical protein IPF57_16540 [Gammaproteobacteria bacterium]|nr:hypothetical protein [Gammaproteobacteria bacterium]
MIVHRLRAGGHGGICRLGIAADGLAIDAGTPGNLVLARAVFEQRGNRDLQMWLQGERRFIPTFP